MAQVLQIFSARCQEAGAVSASCKHDFVVSLLPYVQSVPRFNASLLRANVRNTVTKECLSPAPLDYVGCPCKGLGGMGDGDFISFVA